MIMPIKEKEGYRMMICGNGSTFVLPDEIPELHIDSELIDEETQKMIDALREPVELSCSFNLPVSPGELIFVLCGGCTWEQIQQNNWRKLHGFPMRRNKYGRHV